MCDVGHCFYFDLVMVIFMYITSAIRVDVKLAAGGNAAACRCCLSEWKFMGG